MLHGIASAPELPRMLGESFLSLAGGSMTERRRVLYVGALQPGSTALHRRTALEQLGLSVISLDTHPFASAGPRLARSARHRLAWGGPVISRLNSELVALGGDSDVDLVWIDKGVWIKPATLAALSVPGRRLIHYAGDSMILIQRSRHFLASIPLYDVVITAKRYELEAYELYGAQRVMLLLHGYDQELFRPRPLAVDEQERFASDVCFVGRHERHYRHRIRAASETGAEVAVWGGWQRAAVMRPWVQRVVRGPGVWNEDYVRALNGAKIGLGLLTRLAPDESTTRTFEIPACGTMLLAERSREHSELFEEGKEAEFFTGDGEMQEKIRWYMSHDRARNQIAAAGRERAVQSSYTYLERMRSAIEAIG